MTRTHLATLAGLAAAVLCALQLDRAQAVGIVGGYLLGAAVSLAGGAWQSHVARVRPKLVMRAMVESFLMQFAVLLMAALVLRFAETLAPLADWRSFLLAFAAAAFLCLVLGSFDTARTLKEGQAH